MKRSRLALLAALTLAGSACGSSTDYGSGGGYPGSPPPPPPTADVLIVVNAEARGAQAFSPPTYTTTLGAGATVQVKWGNADAVTHRLVANGATPLFDSNNIGPGGTYTFAFNAAGTIDYHCSIHPGMVGKIQVNAPQ